MNLINNKMSPGSKSLSMATKSPAFSIAGPDVCFKFTPISLAITNAIVVLPKPGGPNKRVWSRASSRSLAASIKIFNWSLTLS